MAQNTILPAAISYQNFLLENIMAVEEAFGKQGLNMTVPQRDILIKTSSLVNALYSTINDLKISLDKANALKSQQKKAESYGKDVTPLIEKLGGSCTSLEGLIDNELWPLPKFQELLFTR
jgi:glutamine synthetase